MMMKINFQVYKYCNWNNCCLPIEIVQEWETTSVMSFAPLEEGQISIVKTDSTEPKAYPKYLEGILFQLGSLFDKE